MKRTFLLGLTVCMLHVVQAQEAPTITNPYPKNEFTVGIGYAPGLKEYIDMPSFDLETCSPLYEYNSGKYTLSNEQQTLSVALAYHRHLYKHWAVGIQAGWTHTYRYKYGIISGEREGSCRMHNIMLLADFRYYFAITQVSQLYAGISAGATDRMYRGFYDASFSHKIKPIGHITFFGVMIGKRLFGFSEVGAGMLGVLRCGAGYRF